MSLTVIHKDIKNNTCLVKSSKTGKSFPVKMLNWTRFLVCVGDIAIVKKSPVSGEWLLTDYVRNIDNQVEA